MGRKGEGIVWEKPKKPKLISKYLPTQLPSTDEGCAEKTAKISKDARGMLFVRFPKEIETKAELSEGDEIEYKVTFPFPAKNKNDIRFTMKLKRAG